MKHVLFVLISLSLQSPLSRADNPAFNPAGESSRVMIHNVMGGEIRGSHDGGANWATIGHVIKSVEGKYWLPTVDDQVFAFNFLRGPSNMFATANNVFHFRFSDPDGYKLPADPDAPLIPPHGLSVICKEELTNGSDTDAGFEHTIATDIPGGTSLFSHEWSTRVGSKVFLGDGTHFAPIPYDVGPDSRDPARAYILIVNERAKHELQYLEFENKDQGQIIIKRQDAPRVQIAKVVKTVEGVGRFSGGEYLNAPGQIRANHAGVIDVGTTDVGVDPTHPAQAPGADLNELRGGFQICPSQHWQDDSMQRGKGAAMVFLVIGPIIDPPNFKRYDVGVEGSYPLFYQGLRGGTGKAFYKFRGDDKWYETQDALKLGKFKHRDGTPIAHLRGWIKDALVEVTAFRLYADIPHYAVKYK